MKTALITGITGQDGSYLAEFLLAQGYRVYGLVRQCSSPNCHRIQHILEDLEIVSADLLDQTSLVRALEGTRPDEVYNLASQSFVPTSWKQATYTSEVTGIGVTRLLEAILQTNPAIRFFQASSSEMFGKVRETPQRETTPFYPRSPYGVSKCYGHHITVNYRESYGLFAVSGICFNHESPRRGLQFVTRKVSHAVARLKNGLDQRLPMGNLEAVRDWGYAKDYVEAMWLMLQTDKPSDYVVATGKTHSVRDLLEIAFSHVGLNSQDYVYQDPDLLRPAEVDYLVGDASKARSELGWTPKTTFDELIALMVEQDLQLVRDSRAPRTMAAVSS